MTVRNQAIRIAAVAATGAAALATGAVPAHASALAGAPCVQKIAVVNNAAFVASFRVATNTGVESPSTDGYPINQWRIVDLTTTGIPVGTDVRPVVRAAAGVDRAATSFVSFCDNGQTATYTVSGTTQDFSVTLLS